MLANKFKIYLVTQSFTIASKIDLKTLFRIHF